MKNMTGFICRKAGAPDICSSDPEVKTAAELSGYICTSGEFEEDALASAEQPQADFVCRKAGVPDVYGNDEALKTACELSGYICTSV